jgi:hypothetical protein
MVLLDWTRMGRSYCLAGVTSEKGAYRVVRPLPSRFRASPIHNVGWSAYLLDGHARWEIFELVGITPSLCEAPHREDVWVRGLRPRRLTASVPQRREILKATSVEREQPLFGAPLQSTRGAAYLLPGTGERSLATLALPAEQIVFHGCHRVGAVGADIRVTLGVPHLESRQLPVKDHHLLLRAESTSPHLEVQLQTLQEAVRHMGDPVMVRLGLSRPFPTDPTRGPSYCWLMVDGFFSLNDPQA